MTDKNKEQAIYQVTLLGSLVNMLLTLLKLAAGILGNSAAMIADAIHSLSDFITDIIVVLFVRISYKPQDKDHDYGHGKYETLATLLIGVALAIVGIGLFWNSATLIHAFFEGKKIESPGMIALWMALISMLTKEILYRYTLYKGKQLISKVVVANAWHHRSDVLSSLGTTLGIGGAILLGEQWSILDPIAALVVSLYIIKIAYELSKPCTQELLEKSLSDDIENEIIAIILSCDGVSEPHQLRTRRIGNNYAIEVHVRMNGTSSLTEAHQKSIQVEDKIKERFGKKTHIGIHIEPTKESES